MSKEMDNHSFNERNSLTGNSGMQSLSSTKPRIQPIRIKALMDMYGSDEEDSEDKGKDSSDSECDDIQQLPEDDEPRELQNSSVQLSDKLSEYPVSITEENSSVSSFPVREVLSSLANENIVPSKIPIKLDCRESSSKESKINEAQHVRDSLSMRFTDNFSNDELSRKSQITNENIIPSVLELKLETQESPLTESRINEEQDVRNSSSMRFTNNSSNDEKSRKNQIQEVASISSGTAPLVNTQIDCSMHKSTIHTNRRSNIEFEALDGFSEKSGLSAIAEKESMNYLSAPHVVPVCKEKHLHPSNSNQSDFISGGSSILKPVTPAPHLATDTPMKNNPPLGSLRPTPSLSHRSIFQTPQNSKIFHDYSKNHVPTPATIFGNWSQKHMSQTPLQDRSVSCDSLRSAMPPILSHGTHEIPKYRGNDEKRVRRPLAETTQPNHHAQNENLSYNVESSSTKVHEPSQSRGVFETINEKSSNKTKENRYPMEKSSSVGEPARRKISDSFKDMSSSSKETCDNRSNVPIVNSQIYENPEIFRSSRSQSANFGSALMDEKLSLKVESSSNKSNEHQNRGIFKVMNDKCSNKSVNLIQHETQDNKHQIEISANSDEPQRKISDSREEMASSSNEIGKNSSKISIGTLNIFDKPESILAKCLQLTASGSAGETKNDSERANNVQMSIPSRIRRSNQGQRLTIKGREYLVLGALGEGMSGQVVRVQDIATQELRAIKIVDLSRMDRDCAQGCLQEISMLHKLQAPCVVSMFDHEIQFPIIYVVLEMGDTDFKSFLTSMAMPENKRLPLTMILYYWTEMLTAVKHIHDHGVIHSDLKPANFLLVRGRLKLIDFGIASSMNGDMTSVVKNTTTGTINYISPEAMMDVGGNGDSPNRNVKYKITFKSDVWSLGCILYSLVYGYPPFQQIRPQWAKVNAITNPNFKISFPLSTGNDVEPTPPILIDVMRKCLKHDPKARPTVAQLLTIPYIPIKQNSINPAPDIPPNILTKIKHSLTDLEWRQYTEIMETRRNQS